jgi:outer membrane protein OmpA-like peptidoglycan-associated protein
VVNYLTRTHGISRDMFAARGFGEANPKVDARTAEALNKNRRVELKLTLGGKCKK